MKPKKKLIRTVALKFFEDNANGEWGVTHKDTQTDDSGFNAFWDGRGLFHDVFEHAHEYTDKHFLGNSAMNIGGEIAAMGSLWYFYSTCGFSRRMDNPFFGYQTIAADESALRSTLDMMHENIADGSAQFGSTLETSLPVQKECDDQTIEWLAQEHFDRVQSIMPRESDSDAKEYGTIYKQSVTLEKLQSLYRYGYAMAQKLYPEGLYRNGAIMEDFLQFWNAFCKKNPAEGLARAYRSLTFKLYRDAEGLCSWTAEFLPMYGVPSDEVQKLILKGGPNGVPEYVPTVFDY